MASKKQEQKQEPPAAYETPQATVDEKEAESMASQMKALDNLGELGQLLQIILSHMDFMYAPYNA